MKSTLVFIVVACFVTSSKSLALSKKSLRASCPPKPPTVPDLDVERYTGEWYTNQGLPAFFQPSGTRCVKANYGLKDDGTVSVRNVCVNPDGAFEDICGYADIPDPAFPGELQVHFPGSPTGDYWLIETDYDNYAAVYSCFDVLGLFKFEYAWLLVRSRTPTEEVITKGLEAFTKNGITLDGFEVVDQGEDCIYENPDGPACDA